MQGDVGLARHENGYRFQAERPMEGDELVAPFGGSPRTLPDPQGRGAYAPFVEDVRGRVRSERRMPVVSPARRERRREGAVVLRAGALTAPAEPGMGRILVFRPVKRRKSTADRRRSDAKTLRLREADKSA